MYEKLKQKKKHHTSRYFRPLTFFLKVGHANNIQYNIQLILLQQGKAISTFGPTKSRTSQGQHVQLEVVFGHGELGSSLFSSELMLM